MITYRKLYVDETPRSKPNPNQHITEVIPKAKVEGKSVTIQRIARPKSFGSITTVVQIDAICDSTGEIVQSETHVTNQIPYNSFIREKSFAMQDKLVSQGYKVKIAGVKYAGPNKKERSNNE